MHPKIDAKIDAEKVVDFHEKSFKNRLENDRNFDEQMYKKTGFLESVNVRKPCIHAVE